MSGESFINQTATNGDIHDDIDRDADASTNPFEKNDKDSTDITAEFDDRIAQVKEQELTTGDVSPALPGDVLDGESSHDEYEDLEHHVDPQMYIDFSKKEIDYILNAYSHNVNMDAENQRALADRLAIAIEMQNAVRIAQENLTDSTVVFDTMANGYIEAAMAAHKAGRSSEAENLHRQAAAVSATQEAFRNHIREVAGSKANSELPPVDSDNELKFDPIH